MTYRKIAEEILSNCALHYSSPEHWMGRTPQQTIDLAITNAESILSKHLEGEWVKTSERVPEMSTGYIQIKLRDGSILCDALWQMDGDYWWRERYFSDEVIEWRVPPSPDEETR